MNGWLWGYHVFLDNHIPISLGRGYENPKKFGKFLQFFISPTPIIMGEDVLIIYPKILKYLDIIIQVNK